MRLPPFISSERLILRLPEAADAKALNQATRESFVELNPWMEWAVKVPTLTDTRAFCSQALRNWEADTEWPLLMIEKGSGRIVGATGYPSIDWKVPRFEIGYWCHSARVGEGLVSEATESLTRFAFDTLLAKRVELRMDNRNRRSWAVAQRLGFEFEATLKNHMVANDGSLRDTRIYAMFNVNQLPSRGIKGAG